MMPAAKHFDPVLGVDLHFIVGVGPYPVPHPFVGMILDPFDYLPFIGATVMVNSVPRAQAGTGGIAMPPHIPIGGVFAKPPANECEMFMGSSTVEMDGEAASHLALPVLSCHDVGMLPPPRVKKKSKIKSFVMPTSVVLPIPTGPPVLIGGPPTISLMALGARAGMAALGKGFRKLKKLRKGGKGARKAGKKSAAPGSSGYGPGGPLPSNIHTAVSGPGRNIPVEDLQRSARLLDRLIANRNIVIDASDVPPVGRADFRSKVHEDLLLIGTTRVGRRMLDDIAKSGKPVKIKSLQSRNAQRPFNQQAGPHCSYDDPSRTRTTGTSSTIYYEPGQAAGPESPSDVVLAHELDHAERAAHGDNKNNLYPANSQARREWKSEEEFEAVTTENAYRAERGGVRQRANYADIP